MASLLTNTSSDQLAVSQLIDGFEPLGVSEVAELTDDSIRRMNRHEMARVVRAVKAQHLRPGVAESLTNYAPEMLRRLVFLTRRWCRDQQVFLPQPVHAMAHSWPGSWST